MLFKFHFVILLIYQQHEQSLTMAASLAVSSVWESNLCNAIQRHKYLQHFMLINTATLAQRPQNCHNRERYNCQVFPTIVPYWDILRLGTNLTLQLLPLSQAFHVLHSVQFLFQPHKGKMSVQFKTNTKPDTFVSARDAASSWNVSTEDTELLIINTCQLKSAWLLWKMIVHQQRYVVW